MNKYPGRSYIIPNYPSSSPANQGVNTMINKSGNQPWHPTVVYLVGLIFAEIVLLGVLMSLPVLKGK